MEQQYTRAPTPESGHPDDSGATVAARAVAQATSRAEFGAHLKAHYPRLVAQLCMITLAPRQAHELVQDAYARAWQRWAVVRELPDPTGWIRQLAVRASARRWRRLRSRLNRSVSGKSVPHEVGQLPVLDALGTLVPYRRRALVLADVAHLPIAEIARVEGVAPAVAEERVVRARQELAEALATRPATDPAAAAWDQM